MPSFHTYLGANYTDYQGRVAEGEKTEPPNHIETGIFGGVHFVFGNSLELDIRCQYSEYSMTDVSDSPVKYDFVDGEDYNTIVTVNLDYRF